MSDGPRSSSPRARPRSPRARRRPALLFLQLPQLDNDVKPGSHENLHLAAAYLAHALERSPARSIAAPALLPPPLARGGDAALIAHIVDLAPAYLACSLYLWNVERTLRLVRAVRSRLPAVRVIAGGPDVALRHPFLLRGGVPDAAVVGEGEVVLPAILEAFARGGDPDLAGVAWRTRRGYRWGTRCPAEFDLPSRLPPPSHPTLAPDANGMAYLETSRGCPLRCTYCRYHHLRRRTSRLSAPQIGDRVCALRALGAREIRFIDPSFNARPDFDDVLRALADANGDRGVAFFAEVLADRLSPEQVRAMQRARFTEVEVGLQSTDPRVLAAIRRASDPGRVAAGVRLLDRAGIRVTLDLMYGLPFQTLASFRRSLDRCLALGPRLNVQCLQTLLLPGTDLRRARASLGIRGLDRPPYGVTRTPWMDERDMAAIEALLAGHPRLAADIPTSALVGPSIPDLFAERLRVPVPGPGAPLGVPPGRTDRRAILFEGPCLYPHRIRIARAAVAAVRREPGIHWQFVLAPEREEPLELLDALAEAIAPLPQTVADRYGSTAGKGLRAGIRVMVKLGRGRRYDPAWVEAVERYLRERYF